MIKININKKYRMLIKKKTIMEYLPQITTFKPLYRQIRIFFFIISSQIIISVNESTFLLNNITNYLILYVLKFNKQ